MSELLKLEHLDIDLSDWSDEFVAGFVAGADHAANGVGSDGMPLVFRLSTEAQSVRDVCKQRGEENEQLKRAFESDIEAIEQASENSRWRIALERIANPPHDKPGTLREVLRAPYEDARDIAQAALQGDNQP